MGVAAERRARDLAELFHVRERLAEDPYGISDLHITACQTASRPVLVNAPRDQTDEEGGLQSALPPTRVRGVPTITITIEVPDGAHVKVQERSSEEAAMSPVAHYWENYLSDNGRCVYRAAAHIEMNSGVGYTLEDIAEHLGVPYASAQSMHRSTGRTAKRWRRDTGTDEPIYLDDIGYDWHEDRQGWRNSYRLPHRVAEAVASF